MDLRIMARQRLIPQQLISSELRQATELVSWFGAIQGQEYAQAKWAIGLRLPHLSEKQIEQEIDNGRIIRTHLLRPTWHFVAAEDLRWMLKLTAPRVNAINAFMYRQTELDQKLFTRCHKIIEKALSGNVHLTREELAQALANHKIIAQGTRLACIMMEAELAGLICSGRRRGKQLTYALIEERVAPTRERTGDEALAELCERYFRSHGPASLRDFAAWSGLTMSDCKKGLALCGKLFEQETIGAEIYSFAPERLMPSENPGPLLLPIYDEYIIGYKNREAMLQTNKKMTNALVFDNTILLDGQVVGTWKRNIKPKAIELSYTLFSPLPTRQQSALKKIIARFGSFHDLPISTV